MDALKAAIEARKCSEWRYETSIDHDGEKITFIIIIPAANVIESTRLSAIIGMTRGLMLMGPY